MWQWLADLSPICNSYGISKSSSLSMGLGTWKICREGLPLETVGALGVTSSVISGAMVFMKSSSPWKRTVSVKARSDLHKGHFFDRPSSPLYQLSTHLLHPRILLQQRVNINGGRIGLDWHILHLNVSRSNVCRPGGSFMPLLNVNTELISFRIPFISKVSWSNCTGMCFPFLEGGSSSSLSLSDMDHILFATFAFNTVELWSQHCKYFPASNFPKL